MSASPVSSTSNSPQTIAMIGDYDLATAFGWGMLPLWEGLLANRTAIAPTDRFAGAQFPVNLAATVPGLDTTAQTESSPSRVWQMLDRLLEPLVGKLDASTPVILSTTVGEIEYIQQAAAMNDDVRRASLAAQADPSVLLGRITKKLGLTGRAWVVSTACASSTAAIGMAGAMVSQRQAPDVLVVAADALCEFVYSGFTALSSLSETPARPFDANRTGLSLGEAAAWMMVTSKQPTSTDNNAPAPTHIAGWGSSSDASHMTAPDPKGTGLQRAVKRACAMASCESSDSAFVAAHGTATLYSDAMEMAAFDAMTHKHCPIFSIKGGIGHTLGAAGIVQLLVAHHALQKHIVPPTAGLLQPDPDAQGRIKNTPVKLTPAAGKPLIALTTNSGFGGVNSAIVLRQGDAQ